MRFPEHRKIPVGREPTEGSRLARFTTFTSLLCYSANLLQKNSLNSLPEPFWKSLRKRRRLAFSTAGTCVRSFTLALEAGKLGEMNHVEQS